MLAAVDGVLSETGAGERPRLLCSEQGRPAGRRAQAGAVLPAPRRGSGVRRHGGGPRRAARGGGGAVPRHPAAMELLLPYTEGGSLSELHEVAGEMEREDTPAGVVVRARVPAIAAPRFERFVVNGARSTARDDAALPAPLGRRRRARPGSFRRRRASTCTRPRRPPSSPASARAWAPGSRSPSRPATPASWSRGRARRAPRDRAGQCSGADRRRIPRRGAGPALERRRHEPSRFRRRPDRPARGGARGGARAWRRWPNWTPPPAARADSAPPAAEARAKRPNCRNALPCGGSTPRTSADTESMSDVQTAPPARPPCPG